MADGLIRRRDKGEGLKGQDKFVFDSQVSVGWAQPTRCSGGLRPPCTTNTPQFAAGILISAFCLLSSTFCYAEELQDPTRPPAIIAAPVAASGEVETKPLGLQSVIISKDRRAAIIDGATVELGGKHGDARLVEVNEDNVVLKSAKGRQVLTLFPDVRMAARKKVAPQSPADNVQSVRQTNKQAQTNKLKQKNRRKQTTKPAPHKEEK